MPETISIAVAAYNEREVILDTIREILRALEGLNIEAEILVIDDASTDGTAEFCKKAKELSPIVKSYRNKANLGFGGVYFTGATLATKGRYMILPGDNAWDWASNRKIFSAIGQADIVVSYPTNPKIRKLRRRVLTKVFTWIMNRISGRRLKYYNGPSIFKTESVRMLKNITYSFAFQAEVICQLLQRGASVVEVGVELRESPERESNAFRFKNVWGVCKSVLRLGFKKFLRFPVNCL